LSANFTDQAPSLVFCDIQKFQQILTNLISNAIKFTSQGGVYVTVDAPDKETWQVKVRDTGVGMPAQSTKYIFEKFQQVGAGLNTQDQKGTGLGLAIVKGFVELMEGQIQVETKEGQGSTFTVSFPRDRRKLLNLTESE
jgi:signal transduction histidine kinase